jgi:hypothetical protein
MPDQYFTEMKAAYRMASSINNTTTWLSIFTGPIHLFMIKAFGAQPR